MVVRINKWLVAIRPKTLTASISPVIVGLAYAYSLQELNIFVALVTLLSALLIQIGSNFANDVYDFLKGTDNEDRLGPKRATQSGLITPNEMKKAMLLVFTSALLLGCYLAWIGGWVIVAIGTLSIISAIAYTGGPYPLGYHGWGDVFVFMFFGIVAVPGTFFLQTGEVDTNVFLLGAGIGALSTAILVVNNVRDADTDVKTGKKTLAVRFGKSFSKYQYAVLMLIAFGIPVYLAETCNIFPLYLPIFLIPVAGKLILQVFFEEGIVLNEVLVKTARLLFLYSIVLSMGFIL
jgi:1,4-dihydroxy-2-naphthoate octaprenyltransferase